ncbi:MAG: radical SAM protein [Clostridia bacterium]|nr:radical SAM protein [Clostridia bacterium]
MSNIHSNISIFVPHIGCPNKCSFCNQRYITGTCKAPNAADVEKAVITAVKSKKYDPKTTEIAFFGGSFTAINRNYMLSLLEAASSFVRIGLVKGIRISTRPDAIDDEILLLLKEHNVTAIELGAQSFNNYVLKMNNRGHTAQDTEVAARLIRKHGFELGLQIMTGLYADDNESLERTLKKVIEIKPDTVRIYPTVVLADTDLAALYIDGAYKPQTLAEAIKICSKLYLTLTKEGINVIRLGLHSIEDGAYIAGPWHPAFSELCQSQIMLTKVLTHLFDKGDYIIYVGKSDVSKMTGQRKSNIKYLKSRGFNCKVKIDESLGNLKFRIERKVL